GRQVDEELYSVVVASELVVVRGEGGADVGEGLEVDLGDGPFAGVIKLTLAVLLEPRVEVDVGEQGAGAVPDLGAEALEGHDELLALTDGVAGEEVLVLRGGGLGELVEVLEGGGGIPVGAGFVLGVAERF